MTAATQLRPAFVLCSDDGNVVHADMVLAPNLAAGTVLPDVARVKTGHFSVELGGGVLQFSRVQTKCFSGYVGVTCIAGSQNSAIEKLESINDELETIFDFSHDGIVVADGQGVFFKVNASYERITGISRDKIIGETAWSIIDKGLVSDSATRHVLETGQPYTSQQTFRSGRQSVITASPVLNQEGKLVRVVTNVRDMTEINRLKEELAESQVKLHAYSKIVETLTDEQMFRDKMVFRSRAMSLVRDCAAKFAKVDAPLLITGESGVGKEVIADFVHANSLRKGHPYLKINCGAIPENLLESELFGYEGGAFTGARREGRTGLFEMANGGTVLLDEIGELSLGLQVKLLRFVQEKEFYRVGGKKVVKVDVRVIAATNRDLQEMVDQKQFRSDLFFRLNVLKIHVPALRERPEDVILLLNYMLDKFNRKHHVDKRISGDLYKGLVRHHWTGNVRELENLMERLVVVSDLGEITPDHLPEEVRRELYASPAVVANAELSYKEAKDEFEKTFLSQALAKYKSSRHVAEKLGVDHSTVVKKAARYGIKLMPRTADMADNFCRDE
ncbi:sigma 54-interacting transcriptional regulator [Xanthobacteraceae bacterium Astr-EGSB]|uniref:sigma-54 interaction domain-containing protein n=1 Tax=Astrobacterium formosum TaxID=3069710 RepID=UPI0027B3BC7A|nr:sigma 54-interacting transcriptional regulator [Xanthobacteraceae bacterium Astr-EGSB]